MSQLAENMDDLKIGIETADVGPLAVIGPSIQMKQEALGLIVKALPKEAVAQAVTTNRPDSSVPKNKPPVKIYVLNDGRMIEVQTEMTVGDEIVIKTSQGEMLTIDKKTIQASTTQ
jgi:hypothetical protein